ncbi:hypothetical protein M422DRAFT_272852 [Sphaerobolus stellatus SS14]|uniref:Uncharacterized protein n=1 Tax=Sphaerobolus stellatus (strain SS14) TaxID=990650 RepID=A0A0C9UKV3_SPHS4|nr:hypothetical protein M422DRAFT_272852 [Sphaerobolus stellatus SS14]
MPSAAETLQNCCHNEYHVEVGAIFGACFVYHPTGCERCSSYLEHLLEDIEQHPAKFSFSKDEIMKGLHEAWPHVSEYITALNDECITLEKELDDEKVDNRQLCSDMDDLEKKIPELEARILSLQLSPNLSERLMTPTNTTESRVGSAHPLTSPVKVSYSRKCSRKLDENEDFRNHVLKYDARPDHWLLHMWQALVGLHKNLMSVPNALRKDAAGYFLEEDVDVRINFETAFSGIDLNLLLPVFQQTRWITDSLTPLCIDSQITKGIKGKSQLESVKIPTGSDFLKLILDHCSLSKEQIYNKIVPYMIRDEEKRPLSAAAVEHAAYMALRNWESAHKKGKKPFTDTGQSRILAHAPHPAQLGQSSQQRLDTDLADYSNQCEPVIPYSEEPPSGELETEGNAPPLDGASSTLHNESTMDIDPELDDIYR